MTIKRQAPRLTNHGDDNSGRFSVTRVREVNAKKFKTTGTGKVETKIRGITLNCTGRQVVNFEVIQELVDLHVAQEPSHMTVDIPYKITRDTQTKNIVTKRMKKDYRIVYNKHVIVDEFKTLPYGY